VKKYLVSPSRGRPVIIAAPSVSDLNKVIARSYDELQRDEKRTVRAAGPDDLAAHERLPSPHDKDEEEAKGGHYTRRD
jgi:hypothetical protein